MTQSATGPKTTRNPIRNGVIYVSRMARYFTGDLEGRVSSFYELNDRQLTSTSTYREVMGVKSLYINYGYWEPGCSDHDQAMEALADLLADAAGIAEGDQVLDVGFGYGEQDIRWAHTKKPARIVGLNVTPAQVRLAQERVRARDLDHLLDLRVGSATAMPFEEGRFDRVVALESALHFNTRQRFFEQAFRVLRPGGVLATADVLPSTGPGTTKPKGAKAIARRLDSWARGIVVPEDNWYTRDVYAERLTQAGFTEVSVRSITDHTIKPRARFFKQRMGAYPADRLTRWQRRGIRIHLRVAERSAVKRDYVLAVARKPEK